MKIITVVGARPQFVKAAVVSLAVSKELFFQEVIVHTGQHYDPNMSEVFFREMSIPEPKYNLNIGSGSHAKQTALMMERLEAIFLTEEPDAVLVYGDTNSTLAAALAAVKIHIPVIHVEAGLRSFNKAMPEEINRILVDHVSSLLLCPSEISVKNLLREGIGRDTIHIVGDVMVDAVLKFSKISAKKLIIEEAPFILCTIHRAENTDNIRILSKIVKLLSLLASQRQIVFPIHPRTRKIISDSKIEVSDNIKMIEPVGYTEMLYLESKCEFIITDSGGIQKEAYVLKKPCITLRNETEWMETVHLGCNLLLPPDKSIVDMMNDIINFVSSSKDFKEGIYGNGNSSEAIVALIKEKCLDGNLKKRSN